MSFLWAAFIQVIQLDTAITIVNKVLANQQQAAVSGSLRVVCWMTPVIIRWCASQSFTDLRIRKVVNFLHDHITTLAHIISVIAAVILLTQGQVFYTSLFLIRMGIEVLYTIPGGMPESIKPALSNGGLYIGCVTGLLIGNWFDKLQSIVLIGDAFAKRFLKNSSKVSFDPARKEAEEKGTAVTYAELETLTDDDVEIDPRHMQREILPPIPPDVDARSLLHLFDSISWEQHEISVLAKLLNDRRWKEVGSEGLSRIDYLRRELNELIVGVVNRSIKVGPPSNYGRIQYFLKYITFQLLQKKVKRDQNLISQEAFEKECIDVLLHLAVAGGAYCGLGEFQAIANIFYSMLSRDQTLSLKDRIYVLLQVERQQIIDTIYYNMWNGTKLSTIAGWLADWEDLHQRSYIYAIVTDSLGLMQDGAAQEELRDKFKELLFSFVSIYIKFYFKKLYNPEEIVFSLYDMEGNILLPKPQFVEWWHHWAEQRHKELLPHLSEFPPHLGTIPYEEDINLDDRKYSEVLNVRLMTGMLLEMGVFKKKQAGTKGTKGT